MATSIDIRGLSREEKLRLMEAIWEDLTREDEPPESPAWHQEALQETDRRLAAGQERVLDWQVAKREG